MLATYAEQDNTSAMTVVAPENIKIADYEFFATSSAFLTESLKNG